MLIRYTALLLALLLCLGGCGASGADKNTETELPVAEEPVEAPESPPEEETTQPEAEPELESEPEPIPEPENITVRLAAVGDNLIHNTLSFDSRQPDGSYDFSPIYTKMQPYIEQADIALFTQEVPLDDTVGSYPTLSAPRAVADAMAALGFDGASVANNHMADKGAAGAKATIEALENAGILPFGGRAEENQIGQYAILEVKGIKIGLLGYTYGLNMGLGGANWMVDRIDSEKMAADVAAIEPLCDVIVAALHWGNEYQPQPSAGQQEMARKLADLGVDIILGSHPHVLQPAAWLPRADKPDTFCIYSLGNFVSNQREQDRMLGGLLDLELEFGPDGDYLGVKSANIEGVVTHFAYKNKDFILYPLNEYTQDVESAHSLHQYGLPFSLEFLQERMAGIQESLKR